MPKEYTAKCRECGKELKDSESIYVVSTDEYYCDQACLTRAGEKVLEGESK